MLCESLMGQNETYRTMEAKNLERVIVQGDQIFEIEVYAEKRFTIQLRSLLDGEYENDFQISAVERNGTLEIKLRESNFAGIPDNKRNAHKVVAAKLQLVIPENLQLEVVSDVGYLVAEGEYKAVMADLRSGYFKFSGSAALLRVETGRGNIYVSTKNTAIQAVSTNGNVRGADGTTGTNRAILKSNNGDIIIKNLGD